MEKNHNENRKYQVYIEGRIKGDDMKRTISKQEEQVLRLCHHDFDGLTTKAAAVEMGVTLDWVRRLLHSVKCKAPQLFPILTPEHRAIVAMYDKGDSCDMIAEALGISERALTRRVAFLREHGHLRDHTMDQFDPARHDGQIKEKF